MRLHQYEITACSYVLHVLETEETGETGETTRGKDYIVIFYLL